jgi:hypothetical protein
MGAAPVLQRVWTRTKKFWGNPRLANPIIYTDKAEADKAMGDSIAFFNFADKKISVHYPNLVSKLGKGLLLPVEIHEVGHHKFCPYDLKTLVKLINEADLVLHDQDAAKHVENILTDIYVNTNVMDKNGKSIANMYRAMGKGKGKFWNVYMRICERLWDLKKGDLSGRITKEMAKDSEALEELVRATIYSSHEWPGAMREFATVMQKYLDKKQFGKGIVDYHSVKDFVPSEGVGKGMRGLAKEIGFGQYKKWVLGTGTGNNPKKKEKKTKNTSSGSGKPDKQQPPNPGAGDGPAQKSTVIVSYGKDQQAGSGPGSIKYACKLFYRDMAQTYKIEFPDLDSKGGDEVPYTPVEWDMSDDVNELDAEFSLRQTGVLVPGEMYKWKKKNGVYQAKARNVPDLCLVLDTSSSMPDPLAGNSLPVLSGFVLEQSALSLDAQVAVVLFSTDCAVLPYTTNQNHVEDMLATYFGGGTDIPGKHILDVVNSNKGKKQHIAIVTDAGISNLDSELGYLDEALQTAGGGGTIFLLGSGDCSKLRKIGYDVIPIRAMDDLMDVTLKKTREVYGG